MDNLTLNERAALFYDDVESWRDARGYDLSQRLWRNRQDVRRRIDETIREGIRTGKPVGEIATQLEQYIDPAYLRSGKAHYPAMRLAGNEVRRANAIATQQVAQQDPSKGFLRYRVSAGHIDPDECTDHANHDEGLGRGVWPAKDCPLPPRHIGCACSVDSVPWEETGTQAAKGMSDFVEGLRVEFDLGDPPDLSPADLVVFRRETAGIRAAVTFMFQAWFEQTGLVTPEDLLTTAPTVAGWVNDVRRRKARRRGE